MHHGFVQGIPLEDVPRVVPQFDEELRGSHASHVSYLEGYELADDTQVEERAGRAFPVLLHCQEVLVLAEGPLPR